MSALRFGALPCCSSYSPPAAVTAWDGTRFLTVTTPRAVPDIGLFGWFSDPDRSAGTSFPVLPSGRYLYLLSGANGHYFAVIQDDVGIEFLNIDSSGGLQSRVPAYFTEAGIRAVGYNGKQVLFITTKGDAPDSASLWLYDLAGRLVRTATMPTYAGNDYAVTSSGDAFVIATAGSRDVRTFTLRADGTTSATLVAPGNPFEQWRVAVDCTHARTAIAWMDTGGRGYGAVVLADGRVSTPTPLPLGRTNLKIALVGLASGYAVVWDSKPGTSALRVDENFQLTDTQPILIGSDGFLAAASNGSTINVAMAGTSLSTVSATAEPAGFAIDSPVELTAAVPQSMTSLAADNVDFVATWVESSASGQTARIGRVSRSGAPLDGAGTPLAGSLNTSTIVPGGASQFLGVQDTQAGLFVTRFSSSGTPLDAVPVKITAQAFSFPEIAWNGSGYLLVWTHEGALLESFLSAGTSTATPTRPLPLTSPAYVYRPSLAWNGSQFLLAASVGDPPPGCTCIGSPTAVAIMRLSPDGTAVGTPVILSRTGYQPHVASNGTDFVVVLEGAALSSVIVRSAGGALQAGAELPLFSRGGAAAVAADGDGYLAAVRYQVLGSSWLAAVRIDRDGKASLPVVTAAYGPPVYPPRPFIAINSGGEAAIAVTEDAVPPSLTSRARMYLLSEMTETIPAPPPAPRRVDVQFETPLAKLTWESDDAAAFAVERSTDHGRNWFTMLTMPGTARAANLIANSGDLVRIRALNAGGASDGVPVSVGSQPRHRAAR